MENNENVVETVTTPVQTETNTETAEKTFTQKEFDDALQKAVARKTKNMPSADDMKLFNEWKDSRKSEADKFNEMQNSNTQLMNENKMLKAQLVVSKSDVKPEFSEFIISKAMSMTDDNTDFETALNSLKKDMPQYFGETVVTKVQSSPGLAGGTKPKTTNDIMNSLLRGNK